MPPSRSAGFMVAAAGKVLVAQIFTVSRARFDDLVDDSIAAGRVEVDVVIEWDGCDS
jgi:hypothetical protein